MTPTEVLSHRTKTCPGNVVWVKNREIWTIKRLATQVDRLARGLIEQGIGKGDRVALHMANLPELVIAYHACFRVGAIAAPLNITNISPIEVERVLMDHHAVSDAAVVGMPDPVLGQRVAGFVHLADSAQSVDRNKILAFAAERLADYKVPETLEIVGEIPRNTLGKIDRPLLTIIAKCESPRINVSADRRVGVV
jgi:acyl-CoA synthetase (AMP-forming)/AMP-acid ligase II